MKILITGGAGFIGSHIAQAYLNLGHEVHVLDNMYSGKKENVPAGARLIEMDILDPAVPELLKTERYAIINHHAAQMDVRKSVADPLFDARVNILGSINLIEHAIPHGLQKFIFASSGGTVYGEQTHFPSTENDSTHPISPYGVAKLTFENYLFYYHTCFGLSYAALRYANVYGPRQNPHGEAGVVAIFARKLLLGEEAIINGAGLQTRDYVFVGDVVQANIGALGDELLGAYNVGTGIETSVNTIYDLVQKALNSPQPRKHGPAKTGEQQRSVLSWDKLNKACGWTPQTTIETGIPITMEWFQKA